MMLQSDRYQQSLHQNSQPGSAVFEREPNDGLSVSDRLVAALRKQIELDNEEPERWDGMS